MAKTTKAIPGGGTPFKVVISTTVEFWRMEQIPASASGIFFHSSRNFVI